MRLLNEEGVDQFADSHLFVENVLHKYSSNWDLSNGLSVLDHFSRDPLPMAFVEELPHGELAEHRGSEAGTEFIDRGAEFGCSRWRNGQ